LVGIFTPAIRAKAAAPSAGRHSQTYQPKCIPFQSDKHESDALPDCFRGAAPSMNSLRLGVRYLRTPFRFVNCRHPRFPKGISRAHTRQKWRSDLPRRRAYSTVFGCALSGFPACGAGSTAAIAAATSSIEPIPSTVYKSPLPA